MSPGIKWNKNGREECLVLISGDIPTHWMLSYVFHLSRTFCIDSFSQFFRVIEKSTGINNRIILKGSPVCCLLASGCQCVATAVSTWTTAWLFQRPRVWGHMWMHTYRHILIYISRPKHRCFAFYICSSFFKGNKIDTQISRWICQRVLWGNTSVARNWCLAYFSSLFGERMHLWNPQSHLKCQM